MTKNGSTAIVVLLVIVIVLITGIFYAVIRSPAPTPPPLTLTEPSPSRDNIQPVTPPADNKTQVTSQPTGPADCGGDVNCLVRAAQNSCQLSKVTHTMSRPDPFIGLVFPDLSSITTKTYYEVKGKEGNNCVIYEKFVSGSMTYDQVQLNQIIASNPSAAEEAQATLDSTNQGYSQLAGKYATCKVTAQEFKDKIDKILRGEVSGSFSVGFGGNATNLDPYAQKCVGELYHPAASLDQTIEFLNGDRSSIGIGEYTLKIVDITGNQVQFLFTVGAQSQQIALTIGQQAPVLGYQLKLQAIDSSGKVSVLVSPPKK